MEPARRSLRPYCMKRIGLALLAVFLGGTLLATCSPTAPASPPTGARVAITLTSDAQVNLAAGWVDSANRPRVQPRPVLPTFDAKAHTWTSTLTYTSTRPLNDVIAYLQTSGTLAGCAITVNGKVVSHQRTQAARGLAVCR